MQYCGLKALSLYNYGFLSIGCKYYAIFNTSLQLVNKPTRSLSQQTSESPNLQKMPTLKKYMASTSASILSKLLKINISGELFHTGNNGLEIFPGPAVIVIPVAIYTCFW